MSLINDALKRAAQQQQPAPTIRETQAGLQPAEHSPSSTRLPVIIGIPVALGLLVAGWWFIHQARPTVNNSREVASVSSTAQPPVESTPRVGPSTTSARPTEAPVNVATKPPLTRSPETVSQRTVPQVETNLVAAAPPVAVPEVRTNIMASIPSTSTTVTQAKTDPEIKSVAILPAVEPARRGAFPALQLQGVYYRRSNPSVLINGKTLFLGDRIEKARVVGIGKQTVAMEFGGQTNVFGLP